ncbi:MAG TPA: terminase family protein [Phycisphaerae bacterium]|nr:terminase family protein [Phycisphaerae bacterium]
MTAVATRKPVVLEWRDYQKQSIDDPKHVQADFWCRQSGKDFTTAFKAVMRGLTDGVHKLIVSVTQRQADLTFEKVGTHARAISEMMCPEDHEDFEIEINGKKFTFTRRELTLPSGARIISLPGRHPDSLAGYTADVILTEYALFPDGGFKHWRYVTPVALTNGLSVWIITTPRTKDTKAYEIRQNKKGRYSVRTVDIYRAVADGLLLHDEDGRPCTIPEFKEVYGDELGWQTEYLVQECDDMDALLSWPTIEAAYEKYDCPVLDLADDRGYEPQRENIFAFRLSALPGRLTCGWDVARKKHLSVVWINEQVGSRQFLRMLIVFRRCTFGFQRNGVIEQMMNTLPNIVGCGDSTGLGMESNEKLTQKYGLRWEGVNFSGPAKVALASKLQTTYQDRGQAIPGSADFVAYDLHGLQKQLVGDRLIVHEMQNVLEPDSHCDFAYANALALKAAGLEFAQPYISVA